MATDRGRTLSVPLPRRWIGDMLHSAQRVPTVGGERILKLRKLVDARKRSRNGASWQALIIKGLGIVSERVPELKRAYLPFPTAKLYESPYPVASVVFEREFAGESATFLAPMIQPNLMPLQEIMQRVHAWKTDPIQKHGPLRRLVRNAKPPLPIRRMLWWIGLNLSGYMRARMFGTFAVNTIANTRAHMTHFASPLTSVWYYDAVNPRGEMDLRLAFDHRVFDGSTIGRAMTELESVMNTELVDELLYDEAETTDGTIKFPMPGSVLPLILNEDEVAA